MELLLIGTTVAAFGTATVKRRLPGYEAAGIPTVMIEADMVDARFFDKTKITGQLDNFIQSF
jgi:hypothetical protein